jgi:hypothetical protein
MVKRNQPVGWAERSDAQQDAPVNRWASLHSAQPTRFWVSLEWAVRENFYAAFFALGT